MVALFHDRDKGPILHLPYHSAVISCMKVQDGTLYIPVEFFKGNDLQVAHITFTLIPLSTTYMAESKVGKCLFSGKSHSQLKLMFYYYEKERVNIRDV